jgi:acetate kinase
VADILVLNAGSSTLKYRLLRGDTALDGGLVERIGEPDGAATDHASGVERVLDHLHGKEISAVGQPDRPRRSAVRHAGTRR